MIMAYDTFMRILANQGQIRHWPCTDSSLQQKM